MLTYLLIPSFCEQILNVRCDDQRPFSEAPSVDTIELFLRWLIRLSNGQIDEKMTDVTLGNYLSAFKRAIKDHTNYQYNSAQNKVLAYVCITASHYSSNTH